MSAARANRWKVAIYLESTGRGIGGAEYCAAVMSAEFGVAHDVELLHHKDDLDRMTLEHMFRENLEAVSIRRIAPREVDAFYEIRNPWKRFRAASSWWSELSAPYDLFIAITHVVPPFCHAKAGVLYSLFPIYRLPVDCSLVGSSFPGKQIQILKNAYQRFEWRQRMRSYSRVLSISEFTRRWTLRRWHVDSGVVYPPAGSDASRESDPGAKSDVILSIGRFTPTAHPKRQLEMVRAFGSMQQDRPSTWTYHCVGSLSSNPDDEEYFRQVNDAASELGASASANLDRPALDFLLRRAKIFWHATGYGIDAEQYPEKLEHYGIVTVEAMAAGCVPIVIALGGQPELVQHGVNGFVWNTIEELCSYTQVLIDDDALRSRMSVAAIERARQFSRASFVENMARVVDEVAPIIEWKSHHVAVAR